MQIIRVTCHECGDVELRPYEMAVFSQELQPNNQYEFYRFRCPVCRLVEVKLGDDQVIDILIAAGVNSQPDITYPRLELLDEARFSDETLHDYAIDLSDNLRRERVLAKFALAELGGALQFPLELLDPERNRRDSLALEEEDFKKHLKNRKMLAKYADPVNPSDNKK